MPVYKWRKRPTRYFGDVWVPFAQIEIQRSDGSFQAFALQIDSGAVVSFLRKSVADLLGIRLEAGRRIEVTSVGGGKTVAYVHELQTRFAEQIAYPVPFAIATTETVPNLLGRLKVFDLLQVDFDGTLEQTRIAACWLTPDKRRKWDLLLETSDQILRRRPEMQLPDPARDVACRFINRAGQVMASAVGLLKYNVCYAGPALIRTLFELALQFEYLMADPVPRAQKYLDFTHITRHKQSLAIASNPAGLISTQIAKSPWRAEGEKRNKAEYDRVRDQFLKGKKKRELWNNWYCMTTRNLAEEVGRTGEYRLVYASCSAWAHGDPFSTERIDSHPFCDRNLVFTLCCRYYGRMMLTIADATKILLTSEQYEFLKACTRQFA